MLYSTFKNIGESNIRKPSPINAMGMRIVISQERITVIFMALIVVDFGCDLCGELSVMDTVNKAESACGWSRREYHIHLAE